MGEIKVKGDVAERIELVPNKTLYRKEEVLKKIFHLTEELNMLNEIKAAFDAAEVK